MVKFSLMLERVLSKDMLLRMSMVMLLQKKTWCHLEMSFSCGQLPEGACSSKESLCSNHVALAVLCRRFLYDLLYFGFGRPKVQTSGVGVCRFLRNGHVFWRQFLLSGVRQSRVGDPCMWAVNLQIRELRPEIVVFIC